MSQIPTTPEAPGSRHLPVMLPEVLAALQPERGGIFVDGTFGAGGYTAAILGHPKAEVIAIDRDPNAIHAGQTMVTNSGGRLRLVQGAFSNLQELVVSDGYSKVDGIVLDIGVSSMQIDEAVRGFSFKNDGPLDMRMSQEGPSAADYVNELAADDLANIIFIYGEEPRSRAIARAIVKVRTEAKLLTTFDLVKAVERATGPQRAKDRTHPATRTFQALRIFVNAELDELAAALCGAEEILAEGGRLVVVTFHSLEDRIVKRFFAQRSGLRPAASRHAPVLSDGPSPSFTSPQRGSAGVSEDEANRNPRSRSAKLRFGIRTAASAIAFDAEALGLPQYHLNVRGH